MPLSPRQRHLALQRALKMNMLFRENVMDPIVDALDMPHGTPPSDAQPLGDQQYQMRKNAFYDALVAIPGNPLVPSEKDWLWNYLQHCNATGFGGWRGIPEAAASSSW